MKRIAIIASILTFFAFFYTSAPLHASTTGKKKLTIEITSQTSQHQLDSIKTALATQGYAIDFTFMIYSNKGQLKRIAGTITAADNTSGTFSSDNVGTITIAIKGSKFEIKATDLAAQ